MLSHGNGGAAAGSMEVVSELGDDLSSEGDVDAATAVSYIDSGNLVYVGGGAGAPAVLWTLCARAPNCAMCNLSTS
jgi:hypothetical protein